ncbi:MAG: hypothetical protein ACFCUE_01380 [Candidatus Bathyarchaeia archaeon]|jgi:hypothetical protein
MSKSSLETIYPFKTDEVTPDRIEVERDFDSLQLIIAEVQKVHKIEGYILKNSARALINLCKAEDVFDLALLTSEVFDSSSQLFEATNAGPLNSVVLEGSFLSVLCLSVGENQLSIFVNRSVDCNCVLDMIVRRNF